jgi:hypothetical protein
MPTKTHRQQVRMEPDLIAKIEVLGKLWGPVKALTPSDVVRLCVEREYERSVAAGKKG